MNKRIKKKIRKRQPRLKPNTGWIVCDRTPISKEVISEVIKHPELQVMTAEIGPDPMDVEYIRECIMVIG